MTSVEARRRTQAEHDSIRKRLARLEMLAARIEAGEPGEAVRETLDDLEALVRALRSHLNWEDGGVTEVAGTSTRGSERTVSLRSNHDELRIVLDFCRHSCGEENHPVLLAQRVRDLTELLRGIFEVEEEATAGPDVPREEVGTIDQPSC